MGGANGERPRSAGRAVVVRSVAVAAIATLCVVLVVGAVAATPASDGATAVDGATFGVGDADPGIRSAAVGDAASASSVEDGAVERFVSRLSNSKLGLLFADSTLQVTVTLSNGSTVTYSATIDPSGGVASFDRGPAGDADYRISAPLVTLRSVMASEDEASALRACTSRGMVTIEGSGVRERVAVGAGTLGQWLDAGMEPATTVSTTSDVDDDGDAEALLMVRAVDADGDGSYDSQTVTTLRDVDGDGSYETVSSETGNLTRILTGSTRVDANGDGTAETSVRVSGEDTDSDGRFERATTTTLSDTDGDGSYETATQSTTGVNETTAVSGEVDTDGDGTADTNVTVEGTDTNGDGTLDAKTTTVRRDGDGDGTVDATSTTTAAVDTTLYARAVTDTDGDGAAEATTSIAAVDRGDDGALDVTRTMTLADAGGDGAAVSTLETTRHSQFVSVGTPTQRPGAVPLAASGVLGALLVLGGVMLSVTGFYPSDFEFDTETDTGTLSGPQLAGVWWHCPDPLWSGGPSHDKVERCISDSCELVQRALCGLRHAPHTGSLGSCSIMNHPTMNDTCTYAGCPGHSDPSHRCELPDHADDSTLSRAEELLGGTAQADQSAAEVRDRLEEILKATLLKCCQMAGTGEHAGYVEITCCDIDCSNYGYKTAAGAYFTECLKCCGDGGTNAFVSGIDGTMHLCEDYMKGRSWQDNCTTILHELTHYGGSPRDGPVSAHRLERIVPHLAKHCPDGKAHDTLENVCGE